ETDESERFDLMLEAEEMLMDEVEIVPLVQDADSILMIQNIEGMVSYPAAPIFDYKWNTIELDQFAVLSVFEYEYFYIYFILLCHGVLINDTEKLTEEQLALMNAKYCLDKPVAVQYFTYVGNLLKGDLGLSFQHEGRTVTNIISTRVGPSVLIGFQAIILGFI